jgi:hypothetical protein
MALLTTPETLMTKIKRDATKETTAKSKAAKPGNRQRMKPVRNAAAAETRRARAAAAAPIKPQTKKATVATLLRRTEGASIEELMSATGWQAHSVRAALTGLRKTGRDVARSKDDTGTTRYRVTGAP